MPERIPQGAAYRVAIKAYLASDHISAAAGKTIPVTISKNGAAFGNPAAGATNATGIANGWYYVDLGVADVNTPGPLIVRGTEASIDDAEIALTVVDGATGGLANLRSLAPLVAERLTQAFDADATSHAVTMPTTVNTGDLLVVVLANDASTGTATVTTPTGWTQLSTNLTANSTSRLSTYAKVAVGTEGGTTVDFVTSGSEQASAILYRIAAGTFYPNPIAGLAVGTTATGTSTTPDSPSVTIPWGAQNTLVLAVYGADDQSQATAYPVGYGQGTTKQGANATGASAGGAELVVASTSENPGTFTTASHDWAAQTIAIRPARAGDPSTAMFAYRGVATAGAAGSITLGDGRASAVDNFYKGARAFLVRGTGAGQSRFIPSYVGATKVAAVYPNWATAPSSDSEVIVVDGAYGEILQALIVDTYAEPAQGAPPATTTLAVKMGYLFTALRNKITVDNAGALLVYADDGTTVLFKASLTDSGTLFTRPEMVTGP